MRPGLGGLASVGLGNLLAQLRTHVDDLKERTTADVKEKALDLALIAGLALVAGIFALLTVLAALAALYVYLQPQYGSLNALAAVGGCTFVLAAIFLLVAVQRSRREKPRKAPPGPGLAQSAADLKSRTVNATLESTVNTMRTGSREAVFGTVALAVVLGIVMGRRG